MFTCVPMCYLGTLLMMGGFIWSIFIPEFIWVMIAGMVIGSLFSKNC